MTNTAVKTARRLSRAAKTRSGAAVWSGFGVIFLCFLLSGVTGLIYQVIWLRMLGLVFGHTVYAITTVLAAFMAGLALGSFIFARRAARIRNLVAAYGWLEVAIGISCALIPVLLWVAAKIYVSLHTALGLSYGTFTLVQFFLVFVLLLVPTTLMGGTLPVVSQALVKQDVGLGRKVGALYSVNTFGAVAGVVLAGYVLLPAFGNYITTAIAVAGNLLVGVLALAYSHRIAPAGAVVAGGSAPHRPVPDQAGASMESAASPFGARLTVIALGVSGAVSMVYEVGWTRAISLVIGSSTYAFSAMLVAFLVGIAAGSGLYSWLAGNRRPSPAAFAALQAFIAVTSATTLFFFERIPELFLHALRMSNSPSFVQLVQFAVSATSLLPFTLLIGATFPCAVAVAARGAARVGRDVGQIYAVNTLGAIVGSVAGGFVLIPAFGVNPSIKIGIAVNLLLSAILFAPLPLARLRATRQLWRWSAVMAGLAAAAGALFLPAWDQRVMSSGPAVYAKIYLKAAVRSNFAELLRKQDEVLFYRDGRSGTVSVHRRNDGTIYLRINGKTDASTTRDMPTQLMAGHIPMLLHREPRRVLVIGMGSGVTAGAVLRYPVERLDIVEIEPAVLEASRFFAHIHDDALKDPRTRAIVADGRNFLTTTTERYDVIISEPSNPWIGGLASLFTVEFFQLARQHLQPGGLMLQWLQGYNLYSDDFRMIVNTFRSAFPYVTVWNTTRGVDYLLLGAREPSPVDLLRVKERYENNPKVRGDMNRLGLVGWAAPLGYFILSDQDSARFARRGGLNTDDRLPLEFSAPRALYADTSTSNWNLVRGYQTQPMPPVTRESEPELRQASLWYSMGMNRVSGKNYPDALSFFKRAIEVDPGYMPAQVEAGSVQLRMGNPAAALAHAREALLREPRNGDALYLAGTVADTLGRSQDAVAYFERAIAVNPKGTSLQYNLGLAYAKMKRYREAETAFRKAIALGPRDAESYNSLSRLLIELSRFEEAVSAADESLSRNPDLVWAHFNRAWAMEKLGRLHEAAAGYENALKLDPTLEEVREKLLSLRERLGMPREKS